MTVSIIFLAAVLFIIGLLCISLCMSLLLACVWMGWIA